MIEETPIKCSCEKGKIVEERIQVMLDDVDGTCASICYSYCNNCGKKYKIEWYD